MNDVRANKMGRRNALGAIGPDVTHVSHSEVAHKQDGRPQRLPWVAGQCTTHCLVQQGCL
jgi:hypothetical protein